MPRELTDDERRAIAARRREQLGYERRDEALTLLGADADARALVPGAIVWRAKFDRIERGTVRRVDRCDVTADGRIHRSDTGKHPLYIAQFASDWTRQTHQTEFFVDIDDARKRLLEVLAQRKYDHQREIEKIDKLTAMTQQQIAGGGSPVSNAPFHADTWFHMLQELCGSPPTQIDPSVIPMIEKFVSHPHRTPVETWNFYKQLLDTLRRHNLASTFILKVIDLEPFYAAPEGGLTEADGSIDKAPWRRQ